MNVCALIPSYDPDERLVSTVKDLQSAGFRHIIVVDDGSRPDCQPYFDALKPLACLVVHLPQNSGKGEALKMGFLTFLTQGWADAGVVTVDGDGQHSGQDALRCARALLRHPHALILGGRDFSGSQVPARSRRGNRAMAALLNRLCGIPLRDTQTGLRAIPASCLPAFSGISGSRYEYETNMLLYCKRHHIPMAEVPISTIYIEDNAGSHYHPVRDSLRIGLILCRCLLTSAAGLLAGLAVFWILYPVRVLRALPSASLDLDGSDLLLFRLRPHRLFLPPHGRLPVRSRHAAGVLALQRSSGSAVYPQRSSSQFSGHCVSGRPAAAGKGRAGLCPVSLLLPAPGPYFVFPGACRGATSTCFEIDQAAPGRPGAAAFSAAVFRNCYAGFMCCFRNDGMLLL